MANHEPDVNEAQTQPRHSPWVMPAWCFALGGILSLGLLSVFGVILALVALLTCRRYPEGRYVTWLSLAALVVSVATLAYCGSFFLRARDKAFRQNCLCNVDQLTLCALQYCADHEDRLPLADNWCDALFPYVKNEQLYNCWSGHYDPCDYVYNSALSGVRRDQVTSPHETVVIFDGVAGWNASGGVELVDYRHEHYEYDRCAVVGVADGARNSLPPDQHLDWWDPFR